MESNLLSTKLFIPEPRQDYIVRENLLASLDISLNRTLTLVAAPPGYGKTTLLSVWIKERDFPAAWLSLDSGDNDSILFLHYLIAALQNIDTEIGNISLAMIKNTQGSSPASVLSALLNDLAQLERDSVLVLDDFHSIENQDVHDHLEYLLDHLPPSIHIVLASRSDPPLSISRLRSRNQLLEIRQADLRLTPEESSLFLRQSMGVDLSDQQVSQLESRTEGWFAGLQFAGLSLGRYEDQDAFLHSFSGSHRYVIDYLADEVFKNQSEEMQEFLRKIAILDRFTAPLCEAITGNQDASRLMAQLDEGNLFLVALDDQRRWYRFQHLFRDYLLTQSDHEQQNSLQRQAAKWFLENNFFSEAVKYAAASGDNDLVVAAITRAARGAFETGEIAALTSWLKMLPDQVLMSNGQLATYMGLITFFSVGPEKSIPFVEAAVQNFPADAPSAIQGQLMSLQAHITLFTGELDRSINFAREALEFLDPDDLFFRNLTLNVMGQILEMKGDVTGAVEIYRQAVLTSQEAGDQLGTLVVFTNLILALNELGRRKEALDICREFVQDTKWISQSGTYLSDGAYLTWSLLSYEANQLDLALEQVQRTLRGLEWVNVAHGKIWAQYILGSIFLAKQDFKQLAEATQNGRYLAGSSRANSIHYSWFEMLDAQADLQRGDIAAVERWADSKKFTPGDNPLHWFEQQYFTYARLLIRQNKLVDARQLLGSMLEGAASGKRDRKLITIHLLLALTETAGGHQDKATEHLEKALDFAVSQDYFQPFHNEGQDLLNLLPAVRDQAPGFIDHLLTDSEHIPADSQALPGAFESLSERETELLALVARGYSNREIAEALYVTLGTVKKHLNNIFGKLQVRNRTEAVAKARELHIID